jgi:hypothetical protein
MQMIFLLHLQYFFILTFLIITSLFKHHFICRESVYYILDDRDRYLLKPKDDLPDLHEFYEDLEHLLALAGKPPFKNTFLNVLADGPMKTFCFKRLQYLESKFNLHVLLNGEEEMRICKSVPHRYVENIEYNISISDILQRFLQRPQS